MVGILHSKLQTFCVSSVPTGVVGMEYVETCSATVPFTVSLQICRLIHSHSSTVLGKGRAGKVCQAAAREKVKCDLPVCQDLLQSE